jgi:hypothetical protein
MDLLHQVLVALIWVVGVVDQKEMVLLQQAVLAVLELL